MLVSVSGAIAITPDDPGTPEIETGAVALSDSAIEVLDAQSLEWIARIPLGPAALGFGALAVHPNGSLAIIGSARDRVLLAVDLRPLANLPASAPSPIVLDGVGGENAVVFDAIAPLRIPAIANGAPPATCGGATVGVAFNHDGSRLYASEFCDGTLAVFSVDADLAPGVAFAPSDFAHLRSISVAAPIRPDTLGRSRALGAIAVRPGVPGSDYSGPDLFYLNGQPGELCAIRIESQP